MILKVAFKVKLPTATRNTYVAFQAAASNMIVAVVVDVDFF
jgi:hypothetical protein